MRSCCKTPIPIFALVSEYQCNGQTPRSEYASKQPPKLARRHVSYTRDATPSLLEPHAQPTPLGEIRRFFFVAHSFNEDIQLLTYNRVLISFYLQNRPPLFFRNHQFKVNLGHVVRGHSMLSVVTQSTEYNSIPFFFFRIQCPFGASKGSFAFDTLMAGMKLYFIRQRHFRASMAHFNWLFYDLISIS